MILVKKGASKLPSLTDYFEACFILACLDVIQITGEIKRSKFLETNCLAPGLHPCTKGDIFLEFPNDDDRSS